MITSVVEEGADTGFTINDLSFCVSVQIFYAFLVLEIGTVSRLLYSLCLP